MQGRILKGIGGFYYVICKNEKIYECRAKGIFRKDRSKPLPGDTVEIEVLDEEKQIGNVAEIGQRKNELFRPAAANVDQAVVTFALKDPDPNLNLLDRFLITMEYRKIPVIIVFTKADLADPDEIAQLKAAYTAAGYSICFISTKEDNGDLEMLRTLLKGKVSAFAGPSGVGKSSLVNYFCPEAAAQTGELSEKIRRGKNTTRHTEIFAIGEETYLFDTPGFSSLDFSYMEKEDLEQLFPEFESGLGKCRFTGCSHISEPDCAVKKLRTEGKIADSRYDNYALFYKELAAKKKYR